MEVAVMDGVSVEEYCYADLTQQGVGDKINVRGIRAEKDDPRVIPAGEPVINHAEDYCYRE